MFTSAPYPCYNLPVKQRRYKINERLLSIREEQTYEYIRDYIREKGFAPSVRDICRDLNIPSTSTAHSYINKLRRLGYIEKNDSISRSLTLSKQDAVPVVEVPVIGDVAAGTPILAVENIVEYFPVPKIS